MKSETSFAGRYYWSHHPVLAERVRASGGSYQPFPLIPKITRNHRQRLGIHQSHYLQNLVQLFYQSEELFS